MSKRDAFNCRYCAHRDLVDRKVDEYDLNKTKAELELFYRQNVKRINILDPVFNYGNRHNQILEEINRLGFDGTSITLQTRIELINGPEGERFLELVSGANAHLELGIQTLNAKELKAIGRSGNINSIFNKIHELNKRNISYETSIIYGLPDQTFESFRLTVEQLQDAGCKRIFAYPLMLLRGTELFNDKAKWNLREETESGFNIPVVVESDSFSRADREKMKNLADRLNSLNLN